MPARLKICGVTRPEDLELCVELGVDAVGLNLWSGSRRGLTLAQARALVGVLPARGGPERVGVFVHPTDEELRRAHQELRLDLVQVVTDDPAAPLPSLPAMWVIRGTPALASLPRPSPARILLDAAVPGYGGAGQTTDWTWARAAVTELSTLAPVWLAGGITADNAAAALATVRPAGLDVASGSELPGATRGEKDRARVVALLAACRAHV
jgi:phosphoribosylanthranilate isomerase